MYTIIYFETRRKEVPVLNFLDKLNAKAQTKILKQISLLSQEGQKLRRPYADYLRSGIYELRIKFSPNEYRVLYFFVVKEWIVLTHGFIKKSGKVPKAEIERAITYKLEFGRRFK
ncbi:MAG: hypothetical protein A2785_02060 [Candidatus Chisholmbacteria bacterium RIFCSPHIGHO2_01_FULL_49_18]|uniref:Addiction module toxin RelE n=2 Tax=Candidatus Chisholmiibacteriota TaxID=1817900 RepID=A0A1G1VMK7_9BACT|nr:MAG: hypothetical protein A2785_02060 [Candidatus Chisholmbacteria bacterium RIFCSPHIGHO2_01_FULL_49_18]OGY22606.1 MAG: hypothetical protein A3A65_05875 [Candidatus Chisholmbacteria bacterium RIFCSPLOWO2_01_FULL_49_14]